MSEMEVVESLNPQSVVDDIVMMLANPRDADRKVRYADSGTGAPTLIFQPQKDFTIDYTSASADQQIPSREQMFILRRDPVVPLIYFFQNTAGQTWTYNWRSIHNFDDLMDAPYGSSDLQPYDGTIAPAATCQPHGSNLVAFKTKRNSNRYMWCDRFNGSGVFNVFTYNNAGVPTPMPAGKTMSLQLLQWDGQQDVIVDHQLIAPASQAAVLTPPNRGGYFRIKVMNGDDSGAITFVKVNSTGTSACWAHPPINNLNNVAESVSSERVLTSTLKVTNASAPAFAAGLIYEADVYNGQPWQTLDEGSNQIGGLDTVKTRPASNGYYGFPRIENVDDLDMVTNMSVNARANQGANSQQISGDLDQDSPYKVVTFILPPPGATFPSDRFLNVELTTVLEAMGNTDLVQPERPRATPDQWTAALLIFSSIPSGYENPTHWRDILAAIGKVGSTVTPAVATFLRGIQSGPPMLVGAAQALGQFGLPLLNEGFKALQSLKKKKK